MMLDRILPVFLCTLCFTGQSWSKPVAYAPQQPVARSLIHANVLAVGKILEIEKEQVELPIAPQNKEQKIAMKVAVIKIEEPLLGCKGLTQLRVAFPASLVGGPGPAFDLPAPGIQFNKRQPNFGAPAPGFGMPVPTQGAEGIFMLNLHHTGDYYIFSPTAGFNGFIDSKRPTYKADLAAVRDSLKCLEDPLAALKDKDKNVRWRAAEIYLMKIRNYPPDANGRKVVEKPVSAELNKLLLTSLMDMPWAATDYSQPNREQLWWLLNPSQFGFKNPVFQPQVGAKPQDFQKVWEETTSAFLKENLDKIQIKAYTITE
ncbi:MAG: hypothetical protein R3B84_01905 [Zavarzinella sp.]